MYQNGFLIYKLWWKRWYRSGKSFILQCRIYLIVCIRNINYFACVCDSFLRQYSLSLFIKRSETLCSLALSHNDVEFESTYTIWYVVLSVMWHWCECLPRHYLLLRSFKGWTTDCVFSLSIIKIISKLNCYQISDSTFDICVTCHGGKIISFPGLLNLFLECSLSDIFYQPLFTSLWSLFFCPLDGNPSFRSCLDCDKKCTLLECQVTW